MQARATSGPSWPRSKFKRAALACRIAIDPAIAGAGGCTAYDVVLILKKGRHDVRGCQVQLDAERADTDPKVFTRIKVHFIVRGRSLNPTQVERAVRLSHDKYCSAMAMLAKTATIDLSWEIVEDLDG